MIDVTVISRAYDKSIRRSWKATLIRREGALIELVGEFDRDVEHPHLGSISRGTVSHEYYWLDRWYNIFRFHEPTGELRNYYCNIGMPPTFADSVVDYVDLDIDVLIWPDHTCEVLDQVEFDLNACKYSIPKQVHEKVHENLADLILFIEEGRFPENILQTADSY